MAVREGRPGPKEVRIADCSSVRVFDNPAPNCPHGKAWRESDYDTVDSNVKALMCPRDGCEAIEYHPHAGKHITLKVPRSFQNRQPITELYRDIALGAGTNVSARMREIISEAVIDWGWEDADGEVLPTPLENWAKVGSVLEQSELWWIIRALIVGGDPNASPEGNSNGT